MMEGYPIQLQLKGRLCIVVGGGLVGLRKADKLIRAGGRVRLITEYLEEKTGLPNAIETIYRPYRDGDLAGAFLAFAATNDRQVNRAVAAEAHRRHIPVNIVDDPAASDFLLPACLTRGNLSIAVSTSGRSPALAAQIRDYLAQRVGPEWAVLLDIAAALRQKRLTLNENAEYNQEILQCFIDKGLPALIAGGAIDEIDTLLSNLVGPGFSLAELGINLPKGLP